ncbi:MAG: hypothetical protein DYH02_15750 [Candidatus Omnitrophica bacterium COP1]|nr:hypothetical protein [Candidatus Omnitrophica bacterium COP1]
MREGDQSACHIIPASLIVIPASLFRHPRSPFSSSSLPFFVILAKAGIHDLRAIFWIPTFVGMTKGERERRQGCRGWWLLGVDPLPFFSFTPVA